MAYVYEEYEAKIKMVLEQRLQLKMKLLLGYNMKIVINGRSLLGGEFFLVGEMRKFSARGRELLPTAPPLGRENSEICQHAVSITCLK